MYGLSHLDTFAKPFTLTFTLAAALALTALLAACGGGGGGTTSVTTYTSATTCAGGATLTSTVSQATANALVPASCPAITAAQLAAVTVTRAAAAPNTIAVSGLPVGWTLTGGTATFTPIAPTTGAAVTGSISAAGVITPNGTLPAGTTASSYAVAANLTFANAPATAVSSTIIVPAVYVPPTIAQVDVVNPPKAAGTTVWVEGSAGIPTGAVVHRIDAAHRLASLQTQIGDADWWSKMMDGSITQWTTQMTQVGAPTPLDGAIRMTMFTSGNSLGSNVCVRPVLISTGLTSENEPSTNYYYCTAAVNGLVWVKVTNNGIYKKGINNPANQCTKVSWSATLMLWDVNYVTDTVNCQP